MASLATTEIIAYASPKSTNGVNRFAALVIAGSLRAGAAPIPLKAAR